MIIVEGPDGGGKTQLVTRLVRDLKIPVAPRVVSKDAEAMVDLRRWVQDNLDWGLTSTLYDRHRLISEPIYGPTLRGCPHPGFDDFGWLRTMQRAFRQMKPLVIFCLPPLSNVLENIHDDPDNVAVDAHITQIYWLYFNRAASWPNDGSMLLWDYTRHNYDGLLALTREWMHKKELSYG